MSLPVAINARFRKQALTGVQRFAGEVACVLADDPDLITQEISPSKAGEGLRGQAWEQFVLPRSIGSSVLFSPANTGPLAIRRQLVVIHDASVWDQPQGFTRKFRNYYQWLLPRLAKRCRVATVSNFSQARLAHYLQVPEKSIAVFGNAITGKFQPADEIPEPPAPFLLCVGSRDPRKNFERLVEAWALVCQRNKVDQKITLKIVGSGNLQAFKSLALPADSDRVEWVGRQNDAVLIQLYQSAAGFIFPSLYEGFGIPPLEAMACGCPVAMSRTTSLPEVGGEAFDLSNPESTGAALYFDPHSVTEIALRIEQLLDLGEAQANRLKQNALQRAAMFSWPSVGAQVSATIRQWFG